MVFQSLNAAELQTGSSGAEVMQIQTLLTQRGYSPGPIDGIFGEQTKTAVQRFQSDRGLVIDGIVGPLTFAALIGASAGVPVPAPSAIPTVAPRIAPTVAIFPQGVTAQLLPGFSTTQLVMGGLALMIAVPMILQGPKKGKRR
jgi:peptidoglycan hydrolase-like protein with peptidoglycan-binding domain